MIAGQDFLLDLCGVTDILRPRLEMFVELQSLSAPCWKVVTWWKKLRKHMKNMKAQFSLDVPTPMFPMLTANLKDIKSGEYKKTRLVPGWMVVSTETVADDTGNKTIDTWKVREEKDVESDLKTFITDIITSFNARVDKCTKEMQDILTCMDLDTLFGLFCGERLDNGKVKLSKGEGTLEAYGLEHFQRFFSYICSLRHVHHLSNNEDEDACFEPVFGGTVFHKMKQALKDYLWNTSGQHLMSWFSLPKSSGCLKRLSLNDDLNVSVGKKSFNLPCFNNTYVLIVEGIEQPIKAKLNEAAVYNSIYKDGPLFNAIGVEGCVAIDIALAKGGSEAIVESYYSVMNSQKSSGGQLNETLASR